MRSLCRDEVREVDRRAIEDFGLPGIVLMENAGRNAAALLHTLAAGCSGGPIAIACGAGNNAGDGFVMARHLDNLGAAVRLLLACDPARYAGDAAINHRVALRADFVAAISETVAEEARGQLRRLGRDPDLSGPVVRSFRLGSDVKPASSAAASRPELAAFLAAPDGPYLTVGTLEPRKNQAILPDVFERVWQHVPDARLLVAGFVGWKGEELVQRLRQHPRYGTHLLHFGDLSDAELVHAYRLESRLLERIWNGTVEFDVARGRVLRRATDIDRRVVGFEGPESSVRYKASLEERLVE